MRIAMISEHASPLAVLGDVDAGGQNVYVAALAGALAERGHRIVVYTRRDDALLPSRVSMCPGVDVVHVPAGPATALPKDELLRWMPDFGQWLARRWRTQAGERPDVVHAHFWMSGIAATTAVELLGALGTPRPPVVQTFHALGSVKRRFQGSSDTSPESRIAAERRLADTVDLVIATCTDEVREIDRLGAEPVAVHVVPCGVDLDLFNPAGPVPDPPRTGAEHQLLYVGRLVQRKGVDTLLEALTELPDCRLVVAGGPEPALLGEDPESSRLLAVAAELGVLDRVDLIGRVGHEDLPGLMRRADVVVATPWYEPFGIVPLEAMACGRPFVGSAVGGMLDTVVPGESGLLVPPKDPRALAAALRDLLADPAARAIMGGKARARMESGYGWHRVAQDVEAGYESLSPATPLVPAEAM